MCLFDQWALKSASGATRGNYPMDAIRRYHHYRTDQDQCCCCGSEATHIIRADVARPNFDIAKAKDGIAERQFATACHCGITKLPMDRRHHRQSTIDFSKLRVSSLPGVDLLSESDPKSFDLQPAWRGDANRRGRYSQQYLCVWRI